MAVFNCAIFTNIAKQTDVAIRACKLQIADGMPCAVEGAGIAISICPYRCPVASAFFCRVGQGDVGGKGHEAVSSLPSVPMRVTRSRALPTCAEASTVTVTFSPCRLPFTLQPETLSARVLMSV